MTATKILNEEIEDLKISSLPTQPTSPKGLGGLGYSSRDMKAAFDRLPLFIIERYNALIEAIGTLGDGSLADEIPTGISDGQTLATLMEDMKNGNFATYLPVANTTLEEAIVYVLDETESLMEIMLDLMLAHFDFQDADEALDEKINALDERVSMLEESLGVYSLRSDEGGNEVE